MCSSIGGPQTILTVAEWSMLEEIVQILKPLEEATRELSVKKTVSSSKVIPLLYMNCKNILWMMTKPKFQRARM